MRSLSFFSSRILPLCWSDAAAYKPSSLPSSSCSFPLQSASLSTCTCCRAMQHLGRVLGSTSRLARAGTYGPKIRRRFFSGPATQVEASRSTCKVGSCQSECITTARYASVSMMKNMLLSMFQHGHGMSCRYHRHHDQEHHHGDWPMQRLQGRT